MKECHLSSNISYPSLAGLQECNLSILSQTPCEFILKAFVTLLLCEGKECPRVCISQQHIFACLQTHGEKIKE